MRLSTLRGTKTSFLALKNYDEHPTPCQGIQTAPCSPHVGRVFLSVLCRRMEIIVEPPLTATFLQRPPFSFRWTITLILTSPQEQLPLKRVPPAKVTSPQRPVNQQRTNGVYKTSFFIGHGRETRSVPGARRWSVFLFGFSLTNIF